MLRSVTLKPITYIKIRLDLIAQWRNQSMKTLRTTTLTEPENQKEWVDRIKKDDTCKYYFIEDECGRFIGYCGVDKYDSVNGTAEISMLIRPDWQGKGYGKIAVRYLLQEIFLSPSTINTNCIFAECYTTTTNWDFWAKCGFKPEGILRKRKFWDGQYYDSVIGSILYDEFKQQ